MNLKPTALPNHLWGHPSSDRQGTLSLSLLHLPISVFFSTLTFSGLYPSLSFPHISLCISQSSSCPLISTQACYTRVQASQREREREKKEWESSGGKWVIDTINSQEHLSWGTTAQEFTKTVVHKRAESPHGTQKTLKSLNEPGFCWLHFLIDHPQTHIDTADTVTEILSDISV